MTKQIAFGELSQQVLRPKAPRCPGAEAHSSKEQLSLFLMGVSFCCKRACSLAHEAGSLCCAGTHGPPHEVFPNNKEKEDAQQLLTYLWLERCNDLTFLQSTVSLTALASMLWPTPQVL